MLDSSYLVLRFSGYCDFSHLVQLIQRRSHLEPGTFMSLLSDLCTEWTKESTWYSDHWSTTWTSRVFPGLYDNQKYPTNVHHTLWKGGITAQGIYWHITALFLSMSTLSFREENCFSESHRLGWMQMWGIGSCLLISEPEWFLFFFLKILFLKFYIYWFIYPSIYLFIVCAHAHQCHSKRVKDRLHVWESVASFHHLGPLSELRSLSTSESPC